MKILHLDTNHRMLWEGLEDLGCQNDLDTKSPKEDIIRKITNYEGLIVRSRIPIDRGFIDAAINLKFIARVGAGLENIDVDYVKSRGIALFSAPQGNANALAEHTLGMLLGLFNNIPRADAQVRKGEWLRAYNKGEELTGKTIGIIGYGNMGKAFASKLGSLDVEVLCHDIEPDIGNADAKQVCLSELQNRSDVISIHLPQTPDTIDYVSETFMENCAKDFWIINTARGKCINTQALADALKSGRVRGAALDVLEYEKSSFEELYTSEMPPSLQYLINSEKVLFTPHIAGWSHQSDKKMATIILGKISRIIKHGTT